MYDYNYGYDYGYGSGIGDPSDALGILGGLAAFAGIISLISIVAGLITLISTWKIYKKAGKKGWECIVPIYNIIVLLQIVELPTWYILLFFVPIANIYAMFKIYIELAHKFGKSTGFGIATIFFGIICLPMLAFGKNCVYIGSNTNLLPTNNMNVVSNQQFTNNTNNMNNNFNNGNSTPTGIAMFNQNIDTNINPVNQINPIPQPNPEQVNNIGNQNMINPQPQEQVNNVAPINVIPNMSNNMQPENNQVNVLPNNNDQQLFVYNPNNNTQMQQPMQSQEPINNVAPINVIPNMSNNMQTVSQPENPNGNQNNPMM